MRPWDGRHPTPTVTKAPTPTRWKPHPKIYRSKNPEGYTGSKIPESVLAQKSKDQAACAAQRKAPLRAGLRIRGFQLQ